MNEYYSGPMEKSICTNDIASGWALLTQSLYGHSAGRPFCIQEHGRFQAHTWRAVAI